ncbi:MAG: DNA-binding protein [Bacteroidales bacterium]
MEATITFNELRKIKDNLPDGAIHQMAEEFGLSVETVRNYFGGENFAKGKSVGLHVEEGPGGGVVHIDDTKLLQRAKELMV